jgi:hypothetical protein
LINWVTEWTIIMEQTTFLSWWGLVSGITSSDRICFASDWKSYTGKKSLYGRNVFGLFSFSFIHLKSNLHYKTEWLGVSGCCLMPNDQFSSYIMTNTSSIPCNDDDVCHVLYQHPNWIFKMKQQSAARHVAPLWQINPIPIKPVFALTP